MKKFFFTLLTLISISALALSLWMFLSTKTGEQLNTTADITSTSNGLKIAVIDTNKVMAESPQIKKAEADLKKRFENREKAVIEAQKKFQKDIEVFGKNSPTMKADAQKKEEQKIIGQQKKLQEMQTKLQNDANTEKNKLLGKASEKIQVVIEKIASDKKLDLVIAKMVTMHSKKEFDITAEVIKQLKK